MPRPPFYVITEADIGQPTIRAFGRVWWVSGFIGRILHGDVGKRVYLMPWDDVYVESAEERAARTDTRPEWMCPNRDCGIWWRSDDDPAICPDCGAEALQ